MPPAMPAVPVAVVAASAEPALEVAPVAVEPVAADIVNPAVYRPSPIFQTSLKGCDIDTAIVLAEPLVSAVPAEPRKPLPTVESILAQFRIREWNKQPGASCSSHADSASRRGTGCHCATAETVAPKPVATVQVETPAPQPIVAAPEIAPEVIGEATEDEVVLTVAEAEEHVFEEVVVPEPVIEKPVAAKGGLRLHCTSRNPSPRRNACHSRQL